MTNTVPKHTALQTVLLHLAPGILFAPVNFLLMPWVTQYGFPNDLACDITTLCATVPVLFGILFYAARRETGAYHITALIPYLQKSRLKDYLVFIPILAVWAVLVSILLTPFEEHVRDTLFSFLPAQFMLDKYDPAAFSRGKLIFASLTGLIFNGVVAPVTEELYFRGYLLARIHLSPMKAVLANTVLFSLYHVFTPWYFLSRVLMMIPLYYWVMKKKNIRFSIAAHMIANCITSLSLMSAAF